MDERVAGIVGETQAAEIQRHGFAVENTHDDAFAVRGGYRGHAQVELLALHAVHDAPVLRQAAFGNVELGHDLDARDHRGGRSRRRRLDFLQHAVDPVAYLEPVFERLDVDIGSPCLHRALQNQVDQPDHRRLGRQVAQVLDVFLVFALTLRTQTLGDLAHGTAAAAEVALDGVVDLGCDTHPRPHIEPGGHFECLEHGRVLRVGHDHIQRLFVDPDGDQVLLLHEAHRNRIDGRRLLRIVLVHAKRNLEQLGLGDRQVALRNQPKPNQKRQQVAAVLLAVGARPGQILASESTLVDHQATQIGGPVLEMVADVRQQVGLVCGGDRFGFHRLIIFYELTRTGRGSIARAIVARTIVARTIAATITALTDNLNRLGFSDDD